MAEAVVSIALKTLGDLLLEEAKFLFGVGGEVKALQTQLEEIKRFLQDADSKQHQSKTVSSWITQIRDLAYRSEDVVLEFSVLMSSSSDGWGRRLLHFATTLVPRCYQLGSEMLHIKSELARITKAMEGYGINKIIDGTTVSNNNEILARKAFPNFVIGDCFVGKEEELKRLVSLVVDDREHRVISVWGMGGIGKTTIAKKVFNQMKETRNGCFDCFVWVCISQQCKIRTVLEDMLKQIEGGSVSDLSDVQLIERLCEMQTNKRCLIVVDDLWEISHWNALKHAFPLHNLQSKILVTTRKSNVVDIGFSLQLGLLNMDEGLELLQKKAFHHGHIPAVMAEAVVSIALQTLKDLLLEKGKLLFAVAGEVKALQTQLTEIRCLLKDADRKQHQSETVRNWIAQIRDLAYRSEDVVAEYSIRMSSSSSSDGLGRTLLSRFSRVLHSFSLYQLSSEMLLIKSELVRITKAMEGYGINKIIDGYAVSNHNQILARKAFPNFEIGDCFVGKEEDLKRLVSLVVDDKEHPVISLWGMGGIGKTTIAKKVYNTMKEVKNSYFDIFAWVCISQQCQIRTVLEDILKQMEGRSVADLSDVQLNDQLCQIQTNKRCLIVVDDLWEISHWNALKHAFPLHNLQSKILVTTRKQKVAEIGLSLQLGLLNMDEGMELLQKKAFPHAHIPADFQLYEIWKEMVKKCGYLPLAISLIGGVMSKKKSMAELMLVKENVSAYLHRGDGNIEGENEMHAVLKLSYDDLPYYLKSCFLSLGIFKEDEHIEADDIYRKWIAQGMISNEMIRGEETLVDIAELYLGELASRCMVQVEDNYAKLHDLLREFCLSTGKNEEFGVEVLEYRDGNFESLLPVALRSINKTRHLAIHFEGEVQLEGCGDLTITTFERLRSLEILNQLTGKSFQFPPKSIIDFEKFKVLRELLIDNFSFEGRKFPRGITKLVHLRYFGLRYCTHLDKLPSSLCNLVHLETLDLLRSENLRVPINVFQKMRRLKHLILPEYNNAITIGDNRLRLDEGIDELETLEKFDSRVHELKSTVKMKNLRRFRGNIYDNRSLSAIVNAIREHWNKLQFCSLMIGEGCELTSSSDEVLRLEECETGDPMPMGILANLHCLTQLYIYRSYVGEEMTCPSSSFLRLKVLWLFGLEKLMEWRVEQGAMPLLSTLRIWSCSNLRKWRVEKGAIPLLSELQISRCLNLREWRVDQGAMPLLSELSIFDCPGLKKVPDEVSSISAEDKLNIIKENL